MGQHRLGPARDQLPISGVEPSEPNGIKFETFIFDVLGEADRHVTFQVARSEEFEPLKNADGPYSPETVKAALSNRARRWIGQAGHEIPDDVVCEINPLTALDPEELAFKAGDVIEVHDCSDRHWWFGAHQQNQGWFLAAFVRVSGGEEERGGRRDSAC